eukprot:TRINITY_DN9284_c0_g1_i13.p1 TRINITY_DN9284_c0_g1~~TRINITY_DN9284_c0_g1_i13.p1  ORF type:complete len:469 (+),score=29.42 TRINITY_DN9284_c0_g1_i13:93-1499(+)
MAVPFLTPLVLLLCAFPATASKNSYVIEWPRAASTAGPRSRSVDTTSALDGVRTGSSAGCRTDRQPCDVMNSGINGDAQHYTDIFGARRTRTTTTTDRPSVLALAAALAEAAAQVLMDADDWMFSWAQACVRLVELSWVLERLTLWLEYFFSALIRCYKMVTWLTSSLLLACARALMWPLNGIQWLISAIANMTVLLLQGCAQAICREIRLVFATFISSAFGDYFMWFTHAPAFSDTVCAVAFFTESWTLGALTCCRGWLTSVVCSCCFGLLSCVWNVVATLLEWFICALCYVLQLTFVWLPASMLSVVTSCLARAWDAATFLAALVIHVSFKSLFKTIGALISYMCQVACQVWHVVDVVSLGSSSYATEALWTSSETLLAMIGSRGRFIKVILFMSLQVWTHAGDWAVCRHRLIVMASLLGICCGMSIYPIWVVLNCIVAVLARESSGRCQPPREIHTLRNSCMLCA